MKPKGLTIKKAASMMGQTFKKHSSSILIGVSIMGVVSTIATTIKATLKAQNQVVDAEIEKGEPLTKTEVLEVTWKTYIPPVIVGGVTIACIVGANSIHTKRHAALASLYSLTDASLKEYQSKVLEEVGPKKAQKILDDLAQDQLNSNPLSENDIFVTGTGEVLCYDSMSGRYFKSSIESIKRARNDFNHRLLHDMAMWMSLNEFYYEIGLPAIELGDYVGWTPDKLLEISFPTKLTDDGQPCLVLNYRVEPRFLHNR